MTGTMSKHGLVFDENRLRGWTRRTLDDQIGTENTHGGDTNARLGGTIGGTEASEDNGTGAAHSTKEGLEDC